MLPRDALAYLVYMAGSALVYTAVGALFSVVALVLGAWLLERRDIQP